MNNYIGRKVRVWRCQIDPMIGPKPRNAFVPKDMGMEAEIIDCGIYVKVLPHGAFGGSEHIVPFANIQSIGLEIETDVLCGTVTELHEKRKPGRPIGS